ncbi:MAG TPA: hypothetical protein VHP33_40860 [Polyangiaceae bacterium]|nr:hypothetical protein [Polyangiaceae bacterium]
MTAPGYKARALLVLPLLLGCDIVQGFQDAGTALFPQQSTHLATPALRLVEGGYRSVGLAAGKELSVLARPTEGSSLVVMRFANPKPCEIPDVGRYVAGRNPNRAEAGIAYFHEDAILGTLHFADTSCRVFDFEIEDAHLPIGETERSVIVWAAGDLLEVEPAESKRTTLAPAVDRVITRAFSGRTLVRSEGQLEVFGSDWKSHGRFGKDVGSVIKTNAGVLYVDASGLHRLSASADGKTESKPLAENVCNLGMRDDTWATFHSPCGESRLHALHEPSGKLFDLQLDAAPEYLRLVPERGSQDPTTDPFWFVYLRNVESSLGTFVVKGPDGAEHELGQRATLDHWSIWGSGEKTYGYALVNVQDNVGEYLHWNAQGETRSLATGVYAPANRLIVDWDGATGKLAAVSGDRLRVIAERVPSDGFEFRDASSEWTVLFHDWNGESGRLSRFSGTLDGLLATPPSAAFVAPELAEVAPSVGFYTTSSLSALLPGTVFLANYDASKGTGRLSYENAELRFNATVDNGVSSYLVTSGYLLYAIPYGRDRGIWLATGK